MQKWICLFWKIVLWHFSLTVGTGLLWTALIAAVDKSHHAPAVLGTMYVSFYLFVPFCQPVFWPMSDWVARSSHFSLFNSSWLMQLVEYLVIAFLNSLAASVVLLGLAWAMQTVRTRRRKLPTA